MKRRLRLLFAFLLLLGFVGAALAQNNLSGTAFQVVSEIGRALPQRIIYDPNFERYAVVDAYGQLALIDALTYETKHVLYTEGGYNDFAFSHDGRWLALAIDQRIELWNAETGELAADLVNMEISQPKSIQGPLVFSPDDTLLLFYGIYPAPQALRRTENDTTTVPWLWNMAAARREGDSTFKGKLEAVAFYDYRFGFVIGPENRVVAALPGRLQVLDGSTAEVLYDIDTARYEQDPMNVWFSLRDNRIYVRPLDNYSLIQVDTQRGVLVELPLNRELTLNDLQTVGGVELSSQARVIGEANSRSRNPLLTILLGENYRFDERWRLRPLTVTLIDILTPPGGSEANLSALLFVYDEQQQKGYFVFSRARAQQLTISPDDNKIAMRRDTGDEQIEVYDLTTGKSDYSFIPSLRDLGYYSRTQKNRVLAYTSAGDQIISDFQRYSATDGTVLAEDLRYSTRFDRFFFAPDNAAVITLAGTEWRRWNAQTGKVERREIARLRGDIIRASRDGYRFLTQYYDDNDIYDYTDDVVGVEIYDVDAEPRSVEFPVLLGRSIEQVIPSPDWEHYLVVYSANSYGQYYPGNEIALWGMDEGQMQFIAGDDLPYAYNRDYGWIDDNTAYVSGKRQLGERDQQIRVFGVQYGLSGLPACVEEAYPDTLLNWQALWNETLVNLSGDQAALLAEIICDGLDTGSIDLAGTLQDAKRWNDRSARQNTAPSPFQPTPVVIAGVPECLTRRYPFKAEAFADDWRTLTDGLSAQSAATVSRLICEGLGEGAPVGSSDVQALTMLIDITTGERSIGTYTPPPARRPIQPVLDEFLRTEKHSMGTAILSPDETLVAASNLPGELVIYRFVTAYQTLLDRVTQTAEANLATQNIIVAIASPTPTPGIIGTPRPTLTPTVTPTFPPKPTEEVAMSRRGEVERMCPAETLYTTSNPPPDYKPTGRILGPVQGAALWQINPLTGRRSPDPNIPPCGYGLDCKRSPDDNWVLAFAVDKIFVVRPDGSDARILFDDDPPEEVYDWPSDIWWSGARTLEWEVYAQVAGQREGYFDYQYQRDILGVFPDPDLWWPYIQINGRRATLIERQPGGPLALVYTTFSTGINRGYEYYLYNTETREAAYFARLADYPEQQLYGFWEPFGKKLYYSYPTPPNTREVWYQYDVETSTHRRLGDFYGGELSDNGRYIIYSTDRRTQPVAVWDTQTGLTRTYCIPETGARLYNGSFYWSPDSRYVALQTYLPKDENDEDVGMHVLVLDIETGSVTDVTFGGGPLFMWGKNAGEYSDG